MQNETKWEEPKQDEEMAASGSSSCGESFGATPDSRMARTESGLGTYNRQRLKLAEKGDQLWQQLYAELNAAGLAPTGPARLVAPYAGAHIRPDEFCYECVVPIGSDS